MAERNPSRPWSEEEDLLLTNAVQLYGELENWKNVASLVPGRTNKACRKRWLHSLSPTIKKSAWTLAEDELLLSLYKIHGTKWSTIARGIPGRTDDACSKRYREALDPALKKDEWTPEEDKRLMALFAEIGGKWGQVGQELQRSGLGCRNRHRLLSKREAKIFYDPIPNEGIDVREVPPTTSSIAPQSSDLWAEPSYPYYPPEAYPCFPGEERSSLHGSFRPPTPEIPSVSPEVAPFQFSSSSLSAALAMIPQTSGPLPTVYERVESTPLPELDTHPTNASQAHATPPDDFDLPVNLMPTCDLSKLFLGVHFDDNGVFQYPEGDNPTPVDVVPAIDSQHWSPIMPTPALVHDQLGTDSMSSALSTPYSFPPPLSECSTPKSSSPIELSTNEHQSTHTVLSPSRRSQRKSTRKARKAILPDKPLRLSSSLILTADPSIRPYACGRESCWPSGATAGSASFSTSRELLEHTKADHIVDKDDAGEKPFRCALAGCGKSWKNLNGLQYHLQISTAHYRTALSSKFSQSQSNSNSDGTQEMSPAPESDGEAESSEEDNVRRHVCLHPHCYKAYRQASGLRYHMKHGHPQQQPAQLSTVPPVLARQLPSKTRKMRRTGVT